MLTLVDIYATTYIDITSNLSPGWLLTAANCRCSQLVSSSSRDPYWRVRATGECAIWCESATKHTDIIPSNLLPTVAAVSWSAVYGVIQTGRSEHRGSVGVDTTSTKAADQDGIRITSSSTLHVTLKSNKCIFSSAWKSADLPVAFKCSSSANAKRLLHMDKVRVWCKNMV